MTSELLKQVRIVDPVSQTDETGDVLMVDGTLQTVAPTITDYPSHTTIHDCQNMILAPGLVDLYSHSGEPGFEPRETLQSLLQAGAAGGFTRLTLLPDTLPSLDDPAQVAWVRDKVSALAHQTTATPMSLPAVHCWAALTVGVQGQQMTELAELATADIAGFADGRSLTNLLLVQRLLEYLQPFNQPVALWASDPNLAGNGVMREGQESLQFGLPGVPVMAETTALATLLECIEAIGTPVHLMRISTARGVDLIRQAKARGVPITASTTWMHLLCHSGDIGSYDPNLRLNPPLGNYSDQVALLQALRDGVLDAIAIDHTPHTYEEKTVAFAEAPPGAIGLELALPLLWQTLVQSGNWSALELWRCLSTAPAKCLRQPPAAIVLGQPAELVLFDPNESWTVTTSSLQSRSANTPWLGQTITGRVVKVWRP